MSGSSPSIRELRPDRWLEAASAVRHAVLLVDGVADLSSSAAFQTHGAGRAVRGVALRPAPYAVRIDVGVIAAGGGEIEINCLARSVRSAAASAWERTGLGPAAPRAPAEVAVHVVGLDEATGGGML